MDASAVVAYLLGAGSGAERDALLGDVHAPRLIDIEVTQTLRGLLRAGKIDVTTAETARTELAELSIQRHPDGALLRRAWELRDVCTVYDALYVALTEAMRGRLVTRDGRLRRSAGALISVVLSA